VAIKGLAVVAPSLLGQWGTFLVFRGRIVGFGHDNFGVELFVTYYSSKQQSLKLD